MRPPHTPLKMIYFGFYCEYFNDQDSLRKIDSYFYLESVLYTKDIQTNPDCLPVKHLFFSTQSHMYCSAMNDNDPHGLI